MSIEERGKALEEAFFAKKNKQLLQQFKQNLDTAAQRAALKEVAGITEDEVLDAVLALGVNAESLAALTLAPMVLVAWADGDIAAEEREAILVGAQQEGIKPDSTAGKLLEGWLSEPPDSTLSETWMDYTRTVVSHLQAGDQVKLAEQVMGRCQKVAEAAGGFLGLGTISAKEMESLETLKAAFHR